MKKLLLGLVGLSAALASCGPGGVVVVDPVRNLQLTSYQSEFVFAADYRDVKTGDIYSKGTSFICDNRDTRISVSANWDGTINEFGARLEGRDTRSTETVYSDPLGDMYSSNPSTFEFVVAPGLAPLSVNKSGLSAQAIIVKPIQPINVKGASFVTIQVRSSDGTVSNISQSVQALPVADCT